MKSRKMLTQRANNVYYLAARKFCFRRLVGRSSCQLARTLTTSSVCSNPLQPGPSLKDFLKQPIAASVERDSDVPPYFDSLEARGANQRVFFEVYGCQMNVSDTEIVWSILESSGYLKTDDIFKADIILVVTCSIRDNAEKKIWHRLKQLRAMKRKRRDNFQIKIGLLGCMAERLKHSLLEEDRLVDIVAGPDSYRDLPRLLAISSSNQTAINVMLSRDETYADITPVRLNENSVSAYVSIMRGCNNMCTYCIVPFTRGRERSRPVGSIMKEIEFLSKSGVKEVTLLGQNVNSYRDSSSQESASNDVAKLAKGFKTVYKLPKGGLRFAELLDQVATVDPQMRVRYTSPHPKDFPDEVLQVIAHRKNVCASIHLPAQSGNTQVLDRMRRGYDREAYLDLVRHIRDILPGVALSSDFICGFCGETENEFNDTLTLIDEVGYNVAYLFAYSMRKKTTAHRRYVDDVPDDIKRDRLIRMSQVFRRRADELNRRYIGNREVILVEGNSKRSNEFLFGRNDGNLKTIIPVGELPVEEHSNFRKPIRTGDYIMVHVTDANSQVLKGQPLYHCTI